ncbi:MULTISPECIES: hypothetical protein [unclassified Microcella]|uniref:hypothetical protein n=1 Tax=unclassified Microcella TaxID=2630066 RepID=UPI0006FF609E|nr:MULTISPECIES: hypothetical protein [unclassified Microcella]KQV26670.1 hypothetical protein ASC54_07420 [Yonghaparkia sp. Root332]KRF32557.1 hypothetical protein ASG83_00340 [Yonghaparkia sp. Soil809]
MTARRAVAARSAVAASLLLAALAGCASPTAAPAVTIEDVVAERSATISAQWRAAVAHSTRFVRERWPEAELEIAFDRWVPVEDIDEARAACLSETLGREVTVTEASGLLQVGPGPVSEPVWRAPVADIGCGLSVQPWSSLYPFGGPVERQWVREQLLIELPACASSLGARLIVPDVDAAIDGAIYPTSVGRSVSAMQSVWPHVEIVGDPTAQARVRAQCTDPGPALLALDPPEIVP